LAALGAHGWVASGQDFRARLCLEEALSNAVRHGNLNDPRRNVWIELAEDHDRCRICVRDEGGAFNPEHVQMPPPDREGGRGVCLMRHYMESVAYDPETHCLQLVFRRPTQLEGGTTRTMSSKQPVIVFDKKGAITIGSVGIPSLLDPLHVGEFGKQLLAHVSASGRIFLLLDFAAVEYLSSAVLMELLRANRAVRENQGRLCLWGLTPAIVEVFSITNLDKVLTIYDTDTVEAAVKRFVRAIEVEAQEESWERFSVDD